MPQSFLRVAIPWAVVSRGAVWRRVRPGEAFSRLRVFSFPAEDSGVAQDGFPAAGWVEPGVAEARGGWAAEVQVAGSGEFPEARDGWAGAMAVRRGAGVAVRQAGPGVGERGEPQAAEAGSAVAVPAAAGAVEAEAERGEPAALEVAGWVARPAAVEVRRGEPAGWGEAAGYSARSGGWPGPVPAGPVGGRREWEWG